MVSLIEVFAIIVIHWFADFVIQTDNQAKNKSISWSALLGHTINYTAIWSIAIMIYTWLSPVKYPLLFLFPIITLLAHTATDYYTSKAHKILYEKGDTHTFFASIGFDQVLHYIQLFLTYYYLKTL